MLGSTSQLAMYTMGSLLFFSLLRIERFHLQKGGEESGLVSMNGGYQKKGRVARPFRRATSFSDSTRYGGWRGGAPLKFFR